MDDCSFWKLISDSNAATEAVPGQQVKHLTRLLKALSVAEIMAFDRIFRHFHCRADTWDLWAAACIIGKGCTPAEFAEFRNWLIASGQSVYENAIVDAQSLAEVITPEHGPARLEEITYAAENAWVDQTGRAFEEFTADIPPLPASEARTADDAELVRRLPRLWARFHG
jgi:hypothetical protein